MKRGGNRRFAIAACHRKASAGRMQHRMLTQRETSLRRKVVADESQILRKKLPPRDERGHATTKEGSGFPRGLESQAQRSSGASHSLGL